eukprot:842112-Ditylum_brightwellii.AAC.1
MPHPQCQNFSPTCQAQMAHHYFICPWPFCMKAAEEHHNKLDNDAEGWSSLEKLLGYKDEIMAEDFHTWGCPVYVLDSFLQTGTGIGPPKWDPRSR